MSFFSHRRFRPSRGWLPLAILGVVHLFGTAVAADARFDELAALGGAISARYADTTEAWKDSPFLWLKQRPSRQVGAIGEELVERWLQANGIPVVRPPDSDADRIVAGHRAEIKLSTLWSSGIYRFQQLRNQDYEFAILLGISPHDAHCWVLPKADILRLWREEHVISSQHDGGHGGIDTAWIDVDPAVPPEWIRPFGGTLDEALAKIRELVAEPQSAESVPNKREESVPTESVPTGNGGAGESVPREAEESVPLPEAA